MNMPENPESMQLQSRAKRRQSLDMLSRVADVMDSPTPAIYSLADLIMTSLASKSQQTVATTLRLVSTILRKHYPYSMHTLLKTIPVSSSFPTRTIGAHNVEMGMLFQMVAALTGEGRDSAQTYGDHLKDCQGLLESHPCTTKFLGLRGNIFGGTGSSGGEDKLARMHMHTLSPHDPFVRRLVDLLSAFFSNTVETNLVLTCVIVDLAAPAYMRPEGWLYFDPAHYEFPEDLESDNEDDELDTMEEELAAILGDTTLRSTEDLFAEKDRRRLREIKLARRHPRLQRRYAPPIIETLQDLVAQVAAYRKDIPDLDDKLMERRRAFEFTDEINDALASTQTSQPPPPPKQPPPSFSMPMLDPFSARNLILGPDAARGRSQFLSPTPSSRGVSPAMDPNSPFENHIADTTTRRIKVLMPGQKGLHRPPPPESEDGRGEDAPEAAETPPTRTSQQQQGEFTLSHLLTNIMILQVMLSFCWTGVLEGRQCC